MSRNITAAITTDCAIAGGLGNVGMPQAFPNFYPLIKQTSQTQAQHVGFGQGFSPSPPKGRVMEYFKPIKMRI